LRRGRELQAWLGRYVGVADLTGRPAPGKPEVSAAAAAGGHALGVDASQIAGQVRDAFHGAQAPEVQVGRESYEIDVRLRDADRSSLAATS
jgi:hydrophobic/amphiphilic exporter-1 (mainly G- bacteria), HAE1 family